MRVTETHAAFNGNQHAVELDDGTGITVWEETHVETPTPFYVMGEPDGPCAETLEAAVYEWMELEGTFT